MLLPRDRYGLNLFDEMLNEPFFKKRETNYNSIINTDVHEKDGFYHLEMELPGYAKEDIKAELKNGYLTITAEKNDSKDEKDKKGNVVFQERYTGKCSRSFYVGNHVSQEDVKASFENGVLKLVIPSTEHKKAEEKKFISID